MKRTINKYLLYLLFVIITLSLSLAGCGNKKSASGSNSISNIKKDSTSMEKLNNGINAKDKKLSQEEGQKKEESTNNNNVSGRKIIKRGNIQLETLDFDKTINEITSKINSTGGYVESSNISGTRIEDEENRQNRTAFLTLRIPEKKLEEFMSSVGTLGNVLNKGVTGEDITEQYFDNEAHLKALKIQEDRLLELLKKSGELKDILEIEKELTKVRYEIESLTGSLKKWDSLIQYSTVNVEIQEVQKFKKANPISLKDRIYRGFKDSVEDVVSILKGLIIAVVSLIPYLIIIVPIVLIIRYILKKKNLDFKNPFKRNK